MQRIPIAERLARYSVPVTESGCLLWIGRVTPTGYGRIQVNGKACQAHRIAYQEAKGVIPTGLTLDHLCRVRCCINPEHLEPVTAQENLRRGIQGQNQYIKRTHCKRGHALTLENIYHSPVRERRGERLCKVCHNMRRKGL